MEDLNLLTADVSVAFMNVARRSITSVLPVPREVARRSITSALHVPREVAKSYVHPSSKGEVWAAASSLVASALQPPWTSHQAPIERDLLRF